VKRVLLAEGRPGRREGLAEGPAEDELLVEGEGEGPGELVVDVPPGPDVVAGARDQEGRQEAEDDVLPRVPARQAQALAAPAIRGIGGEVEGGGLGDSDQAPADDTMQVPTVEKVTTNVRETLERIRSLRETARIEADEDALYNYCVSTWIWLGNMFARLQPCFWQGRNRWIGNAAHPFPEDAGATAPKEIPSGNSLDAILAANQRANAAQRAQQPNDTLGRVIESVANFIPELGMQEMADELPAEGSGSLASGVVRASNLGALRAEMQRMRQTQEFPYSDGDWIEIVHAAAAIAQQARFFWREMTRSTVCTAGQFIADDPKLLKPIQAIPSRSLRDS